MSKLSKTTYGFIFAIAFLVVALCVSLYLGISGWFFNYKTKLESDLKLGQSINLSLSGNETKTVSFTFPGSILPGQKLEQFINITNISEKDLFVRAKAIVYTYSNNEQKVEIGINEHWTESGDYYYFDESLLASNKISLCSYIKLIPSDYYNSSKTYVLTIIVEGLDSSLQRSEIWGF